jgi:hypothetical protein
MARRGLDVIDNLHDALDVVDNSLCELLLTEGVEGPLMHEHASFGFAEDAASSMGRFLGVQGYDCIDVTVERRDCRIVRVAVGSNSLQPIMPLASGGRSVMIAGCRRMTK